MDVSLSRREFLANSGLAVAGMTAALDATPGRRRRVRFGANYVPSRFWWYSWGEWHADSIRRDLEDIAALGMDHIRIQLLWPEFQPNPSFVSEEKLDRLAALLNFADGCGLDVEVTVLDGQLSGFLFVPSWLIDNQSGKVRNFITDPALVEREVYFFEALAERIGRHPRFLGFDIANEVYWAAIPLGLDVSPAQGDAWMRALLGACERAAPGKLHVNGVDKYPLEDDEEHIFSRAALAEVGSMTVTHPWEGFGAVPGGLFAQFGPTSIEATHFTEFLVEYLHAFARDEHRMVWVEEFGCSTAWVEEARIADWADATIRNAVCCDRLFGLTWWCSHDPNPRFTGMNPLEYSLGLYTNLRKRKRIGDRLRDIIAEFDAHPPAPIARPSALVIPDGAGTSRVYPRYVELLKSGARPQVVLESHASDKAYLARRGISELLDM